MATLSAVSNGVRSATATQAGTYTFNTKDKYNNANIAFTVPAGSIALRSNFTIISQNIVGSTGKVSISIHGGATGQGTTTAGWISDDPKPAITSKDFTLDFTDANFTAANIKQGTKIFGITGTLDYIATVTSVPTTKNTSIIYNSTDKKYYLWRA